MSRVIRVEVPEEGDQNTLYGKLKRDIAAEMNKPNPSAEDAAGRAMIRIMDQIHCSTTTQTFALTEDEFYDKAVDIAHDYWTSKDTANRIIRRVCKLLKSSGLQFKPEVYSTQSKQ